MAKINPFQCVRPKEGLESRIAALPYDVYNSKEAREEVQAEPMSFLKIDRAETLLQEDINMYDELVYQKAHDTLQEMIEKGEFVKDSQICFYLYELTMNQRTQTGIVACAAIDDYLTDVIKKHENTREDKEIDRIRHVDICSAQTGPIFLAYRSDSRLKAIITSQKEKSPIYDFVSSDGVRHRVFCIDQKDTINEIRSIFEGIMDIYIADGHHRCASAVKVGLKRRREHPDYTGTEEFNSFLSVLFPDDELMIMDYNRVVKDLNGYKEEEFMEKVMEKFQVTKIGREAYRPEQKGTIGMYLNTDWYALTVRDAFRSDDPVEGLDVSILQNELLAPVLGINDPKTDKRIDFVGGIRGLSELEKRVAADCKVAFAMFPTGIGELFRVSDAKRLMPPKSTWFEPKLRSGLFIHEIEK